MPLTSSVPKIIFTPSGILIPTEDEILAGVQADIDSSFGGGVNPSLETPQGQLASSETAIIGDKNNEIAYIVNQVDPQYASGRFQDAIGRIYLLNRKPAAPTSVQATLNGVIGAVVPAGSLAKDAAGNTYICVSEAIIGPTGTVVAEFQNTVAGPIPCPAGTLTKMYQSVPGWDAITNISAGAVGANVESRADFEYRRKNSVAINASGIVGSIYASVFNLPDVLDCYAIDNSSGSPVNQGATNYPLLPYSLYVAAVGGADEDVAKAIFGKKSLGCDYNGNTSVVVEDTASGMSPPPKYIVKFNRPSSVAVKFLVNIANNPSLPFNTVELIKKAITDTFNGITGPTRERIGSYIFASRYYAPVLAVDQNVAIISIFIGKTTPTLLQIEIGIDQRPTIDDNDISVVLV